MSSLYWGVERAQRLQRHVDGGGDLAQVQQTIDPHGVGGQRHGRFGELDAVLAVVGISIGGADEGGYVTARFVRQGVVDIPERPSAAGAGERLIDIARAAVVSRDSQRPVAVDGVEVFQVAAGRTGREHRVAALIDQ